MKPTKLKISNIGIVGDETIDINKPLIIFYGEVKQGKSTILKAVQWVCGGEFPSDILKHGAKEGHIELQFADGHIRREFYLAKDGKTVKARPIEFIRQNRPVSKPVDEIKKLLNPFTLDQDFLVRKNEADRKKYFIELFEVNTADIDSALTSLESEASALRSELRGYGDIDLTEQKEAKVAELNQQRSKVVNEATSQRQALEAELTSINQAHEQKLTAWRADCKRVLTDNNTAATKATRLAAIVTEVSDLMARIEKLKTEGNDLEAFITAHPLQKEPEQPITPDTTKLKQQILALHTPDTAAVDLALSTAAAQNVRAEQYQKNLAREKERLDKAASLDTKEKAVKAKREEKLTRLKSINESCKVPGLAFGDDGEFSYEGTTASMLSTSQLIQLSSALSNLYPEGLGLELIDRGESLGKSIFTLIDRAKTEEKTILATVVGERPAQVPENIGVFVVEQGKVS